MEKPLTITAVSGWALPSGWFHSRIEKYFPDAKIKVLYPSDPSDSQEAELLLKSAQADLYLGYSLGSLWLMTHKKLLPQTSTKVFLSPVLGFTRERGRGGKTPETKLKYLIRQLKRCPQDPSSLRGFYSDAGIQISNEWLLRVPENEALLKGLEFLQKAPVPETDKLDGIALVGKEDKFLDGDQLKEYLPQLEIISSVGHSPELLLNRLAELLNSAANG